MQSALDSHWKKNYRSPTFFIDKLPFEFDFAVSLTRTAAAMRFIWTIVLLSLLSFCSADYTK